jgi:diaminopimelate epimerase
VRIPFYKMHGAANDFVVIDHRKPFLPAARGDLVARMSDRRRGVGADGVLLMETDPNLDFAMVYYNADGGEADFCGNGARCLARLALDLGLGRGGAVKFRTAYGEMAARRVPEGIRVEIGGVARPEPGLELQAAGRRFEGQLVTPGVPHFVTWVDDLAGVPVAEWGRALRRHPSFAPGGANADFVARRGPSRVALRTYERGVEGETLACGSGAVAGALSAWSRGDSSPVRVATAGGDELVVDWTEAGPALVVGLSGPAETSFRGEWLEPGD